MLVARDGVPLYEADPAAFARFASLALRRYADTRKFRRKGVERLLQETVEAAVDANLHLLRALRRPAPGDYFESFLAAGRAGLIPPALAERLAPSAGLRNRLVHEHDEIDDAIVLQAVAEARRSLLRGRAAG